jgi:predicted dehydrogenase
VHQLPGGIFQNLAPHPVYLLLAFLDPPKQLHAAALKTGRVPTSFADELRVLVASDNGLGTFGVSLSIQPFMKYALLSGTEGSIRVNLSTNSLTLSRNRDLPRALQRGMLGVDEASQLLGGTARNAWEVARGRLKSYPGLGVLIDRFYTSLERGGAPPVDAAAGREVVRILDQVWEQIGPSPQSLARGRAAR